MAQRAFCVFPRKLLLEAWGTVDALKLRYTTVRFPSRLSSFSICSTVSVGELEENLHVTGGKLLLRRGSMLMLVIAVQCALAGSFQFHDCHHVCRAAACVERAAVPALVAFVDGRVH